MPALINLYKEYLANLPYMGLHVHSGARQWTESVKTYWARKGAEKGFRVWANRIKYNSNNCTGHEYLLDLIWMTHNRQTNQIQLALECEWQTSIQCQEYDFLKTVFLKAKQKVFIFQFYWNREPRDRVTELIKYIKKCHIRQAPEEEYLLICHRDDRHEGLIEIVNGFIASVSGDFNQISEVKVKIR